MNRLAGGVSSHALSTQDYDGSSHASPVPVLQVAVLSWNTGQDGQSRGIVPRSQNLRSCSGFRVLILRTAHRKPSNWVTDMRFIYLINKTLLVRLEMGKRWPAACSTAEREHQDTCPDSEPFCSVLAGATLTGGGAARQAGSAAPAGDR